MITEERKRLLMLEAIDQAKRSIAEDKGAHPKVGVVLADQDGNILASAYRGESGRGDHAEFLVLNKAKALGHDLNGTVLFVTLEPCTTRGPGKQACADRIRQSGVSQVYIGMLDPNPQILGRGETWLRWCKLDVDRFPGDLVREIEELNAVFINLHRTAHLPPASLYVTTRISEIICDYLRREGVDIDEIPGDWDITIDDLVRYCESGCVTEVSERLPVLLRKARAEAFDRKYADYTYEKDARGLGDFWQHELRDILKVLHATDYQQRRLINVGIGNGLEAAGLFDNLRHLTIVDIAPKSLKRAQACLPTATALLNEAENLASIRTGSQDIYLSLRTYQSSLFDISRAVREAYRVVRQGGLVIISVSNGFIGEDGALIPGHIIPRSTVVDRNRPFHVAELIRQKLTLLRFEEVGVRTGLAEIYVYGRRAR